MQLFTVVATALALLAAPILAAPTVPLRAIEKFTGEVKSQSYIVTLKSGVAKDAHLAWLATNHGASSTITHAEWESDVLHGFAGVFGTEALNALRLSDDVVSIVEDGVMSINAAVTQNDAPWGLSRISQAAPVASQNTSALTFTYTYDSSAGKGVDIFVVDTGIFTAHEEFGGRATWGATFGGYPDADGNGHGTHVSGTAAGTNFGVAKAANLIAVKVLSDFGFGTVSDIVSGLNFVSQQATASGRPTIASMSIGGGPSTALDDAIASLTGQGIHVTVAAGNNNEDASLFSPSRAPSAVTVGATTIADAHAVFSNFGPNVDVFAPGQDVISSWIGGTTATNIISGTSMATPHVAGLIATLISRDGNDTPAAMSTKIQTLSTKGALSGLPAGTVNDLARNEF